MQIKTATLDGKSIAYTDETLFLVEVGRNRSSYATRYSFKGNLAQAVFYYRCINIGNGYKKRLRAPSFNKPVLARAFS
jgi:hypothetical protein